jgi:hypothetical protein
MGLDGRGLAWIVVACLMVGVQGCGTPTGGGGGGRAAGLDEAWVPRVESIRIHPATRYRWHAGRPVLEARVELRDAMEDPMKASALYAFELGLAMSEAAGARETLYRWDQRVVTEQDHGERYDAVTRSYVFPLTLESFEAARRATRLTAVVDLPDGRRLRATSPVVVEER